MGYNGAMGNLYSLLTVSEAARLYHRTPNTIRYHVDRGNLTCRKAGSGKTAIILITLDSLIQLYGNPSKKTVELLLQPLH